MKLNTKMIAYNAIIAAVYAALTIFLASISYGQIQFRIAEIMVLLAFYNRQTIIGLTLGCFIANCFSPMGIYDVIFGTLATFIALILINKSPNKWVASLYASIVNGIIIGLELYFVLKFPLFINIIYVALGEFAVLCIGSLVFTLIEKNKQVLKLIQES